MCSMLSIYIENSIISTIGKTARRLKNGESQAMSSCMVMSINEKQVPTVCMVNSIDKKTIANGQTAYT